MSGIKNIKKKLKGFQVRPPNVEVLKKEPDYEYLISNYKVPGCICISHAAIRSLLQKQHLYRPRRS